MSLKDVNIHRSYKTYDQDENTIPKKLINPCLKEAILYQRSVGYFSSNVFNVISDGMNSFLNNNGKIQLITTPMLDKDDITAINLGYEARNLMIENKFMISFEKEISNLNNENLEMLAQLIAKDYLEIKIVTTKKFGEYHDKLGIITDNMDNKIVFYGSSNSSSNGYLYNYEKVRVAMSWLESDIDIIQDEVEEFNSIWNGNNPFLNVYDFTNAAKKGILKECKKRGISAEKKNKFELRPYQKEAIRAWKENGYNGFYVMATGTGKTFTAIYALKELVKEHKRIIVICAPYKHLIKQWCVDLENVFPDANILMTFSENVGWENQLIDQLVRLKYRKNSQLIVVSTIKTFLMDRFKNIMGTTDIKKVLVVDEAHRFTTRSEDISKMYINKLGLSATPSNGKNIEDSLELVNYFGGVVFNLPIEKALAEHYLVPYNYYPIYVGATGEEEEKFSECSRQMATCFKNGVCVDKDKLLKYSRRRLRIISNSEEKVDSIETIIQDKILEKDHFVVYCGDGKLFQEESEEQRYIQYVMDILNDKDIKASQFTATETMDERMKLVDLFNLGMIKTMVAIKCLDEGINIPSIKSALILSSNDDLKEFVQRRGRILRKYKDKEIANIFDVVVLPSTMTPTMAKIELRRVYEYARLSNNFDEISSEIFRLIDYYNLKLEELIINDELFVEENDDE